MEGSITVEEMSSEDLVARLREMKSVAKIKKICEEELRRRVDDGQDFTEFGCSIGAPSFRKKMKSPEEIAEMLLPAFIVDDLYDEPSQVKGKITIA